MNPTTLWLVLAGVFVALELLSGTIYLVMLALSMVVGAIAAFSGADLEIQVASAAIACIVGTLIWRALPFSKFSRLRSVTSNPDVNLDIGSTINVEAWLPDGTAQVMHRGAQWTAVTADSLPAAGEHHITEVRGIQLVLAKISS